MKLNNRWKSGTTLGLAMGVATLGSAHAQNWIQIQGATLVRIDPVTGDLTYRSADGTIGTLAAGSYRVEGDDVYVDATSGALDALGLGAAALVTINLLGRDDDSEDTASSTPVAAPVGSPPVISPGQSFSIDERATGTLGTVNATDDTGVASFAITGGNSGGVFSINNAGVLSLNTAVDFEAASSYSLNVQATDLDGNSTTQMVVVNIGDLRDSLDLASRTDYALLTAVDSYRLAVGDYDGDGDLEFGFAGIQGGNLFGIVYDSIDDLIADTNPVDTFVGTNAPTPPSNVTFAQIHSAGGQNLLWVNTDTEWHFGFAGQTSFNWGAYPTGGPLMYAFWSNHAPGTSVAAIYDSVSNRVLAGDLNASAPATTLNLDGVYAYENGDSYGTADLDLDGDLDVWLFDHSAASWIAMENTGSNTAPELALMNVSDTILDGIDPTGLALGGFIGVATFDVDGDGTTNLVVMGGSHVSVFDFT